MLPIPTEAMQEWKQFKSKKCRFKIEYPVDWEKVGVQGLEIGNLTIALQLSPPGGMEEENLTAFIIQVKKAFFDVKSLKWISFESLTLEEWKDIEIKPLGNISAIKEEDNVSLDDMPAKKIIKEMGGKEVMNIYCINDEKGYVITFSGKPGAYNRYIDLSTQMINSFEFI